MTILTFISRNPYDGARRAFLGLNPNATDADWKEWCGHKPPEDMLTEDELINLAGICHAGAENKGGKFKDDEIKHFCFSAGCFETLIWERFGESQKAG